MGPMNAAIGDVCARVSEYLKNLLVGDNSDRHWNKRQPAISDFSCHPSGAVSDLLSWVTLSVALWITRQTTFFAG